MNGTVSSVGPKTAHCVRQTAKVGGRPAHKTIRGTIAVPTYHVKGSLFVLLMVDYSIDDIFCRLFFNIFDFF